MRVRFRNRTRTDTLPKMAFSRVDLCVNRWEKGAEKGTRWKCNPLISLIDALGFRFCAGSSPALAPTVNLIKSRKA